MVVSGVRHSDSVLCECIEKGASCFVYEGCTCNNTKWFKRLETMNNSTTAFMGFPGGSDGKGSACNAGDLGLILGLGRSPGGGNGNPLQCSCLENPLDRGAWWSMVHGVSQSRTGLSD